MYIAKQIYRYRKQSSGYNEEREERRGKSGEWN